MPNRLSQWDLDNLTADEQAQIIRYKDLWDSDPAQRESANAAANAIRQRYGYSGGIEGNQYIAMQGFNPPQAPSIPDYSSPYEGMIMDLFNQMQNQPSYESPYKQLINQQLSSIMNRAQFSYDPETDAAYQAFRERALAAGDKAYADNLGGMSAMTGGRPNSWAGTVASQARNQYVLQAEEAVLQFEERAYGRYRDETQDMYNLLDVLNSQDDRAYARYRDEIGDTRELADMVLRLDDRDFSRYQWKSENQWKTFEYEYKAYTDALDYKNTMIGQAIERTNLQGYVNNQDSIILGVPVGTLSQSARERAEAMEDYIQKSKIDLENEFKRMEKSYQYDKKLINARSSGSGSGGYVGGEIPLNLTKTDGKDRDNLINDYNETVTSKDFARLSNEEKFDYIDKFLYKLVSDHSYGLLGENGDWIAGQVISEIENSQAYRLYYAPYSYDKGTGGGGVSRDPIRMLVE